MKNLFFTLGFLSLGFGATAQTTITVNGEATITINDQTTTIKCDRFYQTTCMTISTGPVIIKKHTEVTAYKNDRPIFTKEGILANYEKKESGNISEHKFTFEK